MDSSVDAVIIGMGYVGLPLAREASAAGLSVIGLDINSEVIDGLTMVDHMSMILLIPMSPRCLIAASARPLMPYSSAGLAPS
jgi:choline dehydrogenase-like flavoprotein